ncbi:putative integral membrane protein [Brugia pahangi]
MYDSNHLDMNLFQIDQTFAKSFWCIPVIFHLFSVALVLLHPETRILAWMFFRRTFILSLATIILIEQFVNNIIVEATKRSVTKTIFETSNTPTNIPITKAHSFTISNIGDPLKWDEILIAILLFVIALILFITGMYMVDRVQHGKDRLFRKYINERKRSKKRKKMELVLKYTNSSNCNDTKTDPISESFVENSTSREKHLNNSSITEQNISNQSITGQSYETII